MDLLRFWDTSKKEHYGSSTNNECRLWILAWFCIPCILFTKLLLFEKWVTQITGDGDTADIVSLDFAKAFRSVDQRLLLRKLYVFSLCPSFIGWIGAFLICSSYRDWVNDCLPEKFPACCGVPEDSLLGHIHFLIYINNMPDVIGRNVLLFMVLWNWCLAEVKTTFSDCCR